MEAVAAIAEVLGWVGLAAAALFGLAALTLRMARGSWQSAPAVLVEGEFRWMAADGSFHSTPADEHDGHEPGDDFMVFYRSHQPGICYLERVAHDERTYRVAALSLVGVGVLSFVVNGIATLL